MNSQLEKKVSIIIPVYNTESYLKRCLDSVVKQSYRNLQIIIIDDGSTDQSGEMCDEYALKDARIEVIHTENGGSVKARKSGLIKAKGEYVGFVDSDDYLDMDMVSVLVKGMDETGADFVHTGYKEIKDGKKLECINFFERIFEFKTVEDKEEFFRQFYLNIKNNQTISYSIWSKLFRRELILKCFNELDDMQQVGEDALCLARCILESNKIYLLPVALYNYCTRSNSLSHEEAEDFFPKQVVLCSHVIRLLQYYGYSEKWKPEIYDFLKSSLLPVVKTEKKQIMNQFYLSNIDFLKGKKVIIYGAGAVGIDIYMQLIGYKEIEIVCIVDEKVRFVNDIEVRNKCEIPSIEYDLILIAVQRSAVMEQIKEGLLEFGIDENCIVWEIPNRYF